MSKVLSNRDDVFSTSPFWFGSQKISSAMVQEIAALLLSLVHPLAVQCFFFSRNTA